MRLSRETSRTAKAPARRRGQATPRRGPAPGPSPWRKAVRLLRWGTPALLVVALAGGALWAWQSGWLAQTGERAEQRFHRLTADAGLAVEEVLVDGRGRTSRTAILNALAVGRGTPILGVDPYAARTRIEALPWVKQAEVERRLPDVVYVRISERLPMAVWQLHGRVSVIDRDGQVIEGVKAGRFTHLTLVVGEDAPRHTAELIRVLTRETELAERVVSAVRIGKRRWNLRLTGGIEVQLPEAAAEAAWIHLAEIQREHQVLERDVVLIDMRLPDRLVIRTSSGVLPPKPKPVEGKQT
jgi:cell division protein FtsQ